MSRRRWLLDLEVGGQVLRFATSQVEVADRDGAAALYVEGLQSDVGEVWKLAESVTLSVTAPPNGPSWAQRVAMGQRLELAQGVLRLHTEGQPLEDAAETVAGRVTSVSFGGPGEPLRVTISASPAGREGEMPRAESMVRDGLTWPRGAANKLNPVDDGRYPPIVFGYPGLGPRGDVYPAYRVPLVTIDATTGRDYWVIGDGELAADSAGVQLYKVDTSAMPSQTNQAHAAVQLHDDAQGHQVTAARTDAADPDPTEGAEYYCGHTATGGGLYRRDRTGPVRDAGEVIERLLRDYSSIPIDTGRMRAVGERLAGFKLDGYVDEPINTWEYIERAILPLLPVAVRWSARGVYLAFMDYAPDRSRVVAFLDADRDEAQRMGPVANRFDIYNRFTIQFGHTFTGFRLNRTLTGDPEANAELFPGQQAIPSVVGDLACLRSQSRYGILEADPMESACLWDTATAVLVLRHRARRHALPVYGVQYSVGPQWSHLEPGDVVELSDGELFWANRLALVEDVAVGERGTLLELSVVPTLLA